MWIIFIRYIDNFYIDEILIIYIVLVFWELFFYSLISVLLDNVGFSKCYIFSFSIGVFGYY